MTRIGLTNFGQFWTDSVALLFFLRLMTSRDLKGRSDWLLRTELLFSDWRSFEGCFEGLKVSEGRDF